MKIIGFILSLFLILNSCISSKKIVENSAKTGTEVRDGTSYEKAVIITERNETRGVHAEYEWINVHYPGNRGRVQYLIQYKDKPYDIISITTAERKDLDLYFDISKFFGKF